MSDERESFLRYASRSSFFLPLAIALIAAGVFDWSNVRLLPALPVIVLVVCFTSVSICRDVLWAALISPFAATVGIAAFYGPDPFTLIAVGLRVPPFAVCGIAVGAGLRLLFDPPQLQVHRMLGVLLLIPAFVPLQAAVHIHADYRLRPNREIKAMLLEDAPLGSPLADVKTRMLARRGWTLAVDEFHGAPTKAFALATDTPTVGVKHLSFTSGNFQGVLFSENLQIYWAFDKEGRLIDVLVLRDVDAL